MQLQNIFGPFEGYRIYASRKVAEKIEIQTRYAAELYNVDIRQDQRYLAEHDLFPCGDKDESRFSLDFEVPLIGLGMEVIGDPNLPRDIPYEQVLNGDEQSFEGPEKVVLVDLLEFIRVHDPNVILFPYADTWVLDYSQEGKEDLPEAYNNHSGRFRQMALSLSSFSGWGLED